MSEETADVPLIVLWQLLSQSRQLALELRKRELRALKLSTAQARLFFAMQHAGENASISELARWVVQKPHCISALITRCEKQGYVRRVANPNKKNQVCVRLTDKGERAYAACVQRRALDEFFESLTKEQKRALASVLRDLVANAAQELHMSHLPPLPGENDGHKSSPDV